MNTNLFKIHELYDKHKFVYGVCRCGKVNSIELTYAKLKTLPGTTIANSLDHLHPAIIATYLGYYAAREPKKFDNILEKIDKNNSKILAIANLAMDKREKKINRSNLVSLKNLNVNINGNISVTNGRITFDNMVWYVNINYGDKLLFAIREKEKALGYKIKTGIIAFLKYLSRRKNRITVVAYQPRITTISRKLKYVDYLKASDISNGNTYIKRI